MVAKILKLKKTQQLHSSQICLKQTCCWLTM